MKTLERLTIGVVALVTASCASAPPMQAPTVNVTGDWVGAWACDDPTKGNGLVVMKLTQSGGRTMGSRGRWWLITTRAGATRLWRCRIS